MKQIRSRYTPGGRYIKMSVHVTPEQKLAIERAAKRAGLSVSDYFLRLAEAMLKHEPRDAA